VFNRVNKPTVTRKLSVCAFFVRRFSRRLCLHACMLGLTHPQTGERMRFRCNTVPDHLFVLGSPDQIRGSADKTRSQLHPGYLSHLLARPSG
jgi:hypothetical protein